jgi:uncharacterized protein YdeI (YjbR/CyaY-like superfamily)
MSTFTARFFKSAAEFRRWMERHHESERELWVGFRKKGVESPGMTYVESLEVALCFGWIDGIRKSLDATSYVNRFTPRKADSVWSKINIAKVEALIARGEMHQSGLDAYAKRDPARSGIYSFEQRPQSFPPELERRFRTAKAAWTHFKAQPPGYRRLAIWWVSSAKREETRLRRLRQLIEVSGQGMRIGALFGQTGAVPTPSPRDVRPTAKAKTKAKTTAGPRRARTRTRTGRTRTPKAPR